MKILTVVGARPQFVKAAVVSHALRQRSDVHEVILHTGQHYDANMSGCFFDELGISKPDYQLNVGSGQHGAQTGQMLGRIEEVLLTERPDWTLVYGDTNSTLAGALASAKLHIPVAHVEAGLRSFNRRMPEEVNRVLTDHISTKLFAPTETAVLNLTNEGITGSMVEVVGDVMYDASIVFSRKAAETSQVLAQLHLDAGHFVLATIHRAENTDDPALLESILTGLATVGQTTKVVLPLHPRTRHAIQRHGLDRFLSSNGLHTIDPLGYIDMTQLERHAAVIATDSGGVQKEAFFHRIPCVTLRTETEWVELIETGWNRLCPPNSGRQIAEAILGAIGSQGKDVALYGSGSASSDIAKSLFAGC